MFLIRSEQLEALSHERWERFANDMVAHAEHFFPHRATALGAENLRDRVRESLLRAEGFGLTSERAQCKFLNLSLEWGWSFLRSPSYDWALAYLRDSEVVSRNQRMDRLYSEALARRKKAFRQQRLLEEFENA